MAQLSDFVRLGLGKARKTKIESNAAADVPLEIDLAASATGNAIQVDNSSGTTLFKVDSSGIVTSAGLVTAGSVVRTGQEYAFSLAGAKAGATAGWVVGAGDNLQQATLPQSQTASTLVIPVGGLKVGDTITAFKLFGQIESAGNGVTVDADLRAQTNVAADPTDASIGAITQVSVTADTAMSATKSALSSVVTATKAYYILVTATTGASTDIRLLGFSVTVTSS